MSQFNNSSERSDKIPMALFADCLTNSKEIFELINSVFPVDSCRHYKVLPLNLEGNNLSLGMLNPDNEESFKFVNSIAKVFRYNLHLKLIDEQTLQIILANYPQNSQQPLRQQNEDRHPTIIDVGFDPSKSSTTRNSSRRRIADSAPTIILQPNETPSPQKSNSPQGIEDLPPELDFLKDLDLSPQQDSQPVKPADRNATLYEIPPEFLNQRAKDNSDDKATIIAEDPVQLLAQSISHQSELALEEMQISELIAETSHQSSTAESENFLPKLAPQLSWQKLLEQAFKYHSEEIYLTRHSNFGSIVTNKENLPQSCAEQVPLPIFCSLIDEIKRMARIPLDMSNHPKKVVLERFYEQERILLRLKFALENEKETVIVQILRNEELKKYEQQQMDKAGEQALYLAKQLEKTLRRIQACFDSAKFTDLKELQTVQSRINHQLRLFDK